MPASRYRVRMKTMGVLLAALLLASCSSQATDTDAIEATITRQMTHQLDGQTARVACPDQVEWEAGRDFHCLAKVGKQTVRVTVTVEGDKDWTWTTGG